MPHDLKEVISFEYLQCLFESHDFGFGFSEYGLCFVSVGIVTSEDENIVVWEAICIAFNIGLAVLEVEPNPNDLSRCESYSEYLNKLLIACINIWSATKTGGRIAILIGDIRKNGQYYSPQAEIQKFPLGNLESIIIKAQHNCRSDSKQYSGNLIRIMHEYLLIFKK